MTLYNITTVNDRATIKAKGRGDAIVRAFRLYRDCRLEEARGRTIATIVHPPDKSARFIDLAPGVGLTDEDVERIDRNRSVRCALIRGLMKGARAENKQVRILSTTGSSWVCAEVTVAEKNGKWAFRISCGKTAYADAITAGPEALLALKIPQELRRVAP